MKNKLEQRRQEVIARILRGYGSIDRVDTLCLGVRFKVAPEVITQDVANVSEALKREVVAQGQDTGVAGRLRVTSRFSSIFDPTSTA
jgi:hypothetical protein